jgi:hypothetical protein
MLSDIFGKPGQGAHAYRLGPFAAVDLLLTVAIAYFIQQRYYSEYSVLFVFGVLFAIAEITHLIFGVKTAFINMLFTAATK